MLTYSIKIKEIKKKWLMIDVDGLVLGRVASYIARLLRGKHKTTFTPHMDCGDNVIVINAKKVKLTGNKAKKKIYFKHTGYPGGIKSTNFEKMIKRNPNSVIKNAVRGMLPKGPLGRIMLKKLKVYDGLDHPHHSQNPSNFKILTKLFRKSNQTQSP